MRLTYLVNTVLATVITIVFGSIQANAAGPADCKGIDMLEEMRIKDPASYQQIITSAHRTPNANKIFWKIETPGTPASYLLGTMHLSDSRITTLSPQVSAALASSKRVVLEIADMSEPAMIKAVSGATALMFFMDGKGLGQLLTKSEMAIVQTAVTSAGMPAQIANILKPWFATMLMALSPCERARGKAGIASLDQKLANIAKKRGIKVYGVESIKEQFSAMASLPLGDQLEMLRSSVKYYNRTQDLLETMTRIYQRRDMGVAWPLQLMLARLSGADIRRFESFRKILIVERNRRMRNRVLVHLRKGGTFFAVGALHLPGKEGLVSLLRQSGFRVSPAE